VIYRFAPVSCSVQCVRLGRRQQSVVICPVRRCSPFPVLFSCFGAFCVCVSRVNYRCAAAAFIKVGNLSALYFELRCLLMIHYMGYAFGWLESFWHPFFVRSRGYDISTRQHSRVRVLAYLGVVSGVTDTQGCARGWFSSPEMCRRCFAVLWDILVCEFGCHALQCINFRFFSSNGVWMCHALVF
jgi:hypothetical protein